MGRSELVHPRDVARRRRLQADAREALADTFDALQHVMEEALLEGARVPRWHHAKVAHAWRGLPREARVPTAGELYPEGPCHPHARVAASSGQRVAGCAA